MPRLLWRLASVVLPFMNLHGRVDVFVGRFTRPSQAGRFAPFNDPDAQAARWFRASREALERESKLSVLDTSLFALKGNLRRFIQGSIFSHIFCFFA
jgi:hypothetical protein